MDFASTTTRSSDSSSSLSLSGFFSVSTVTLDVSSVTLMVAALFSNSRFFSSSSSNSAHGPLQSPEVDDASPNGSRFRFCLEIGGAL
jgi:hypothetical protein